MANSEWRSAKQKPRPEECGPNGRIIVWHKYNGAMIANVYQLNDNRFVDWWMPYPDPPEGAETLLMELSGPKDER